MYIVLDANIIIEEGYGESVHFGILMSWSSAMGHEVFVPRPALEEVVAHFSKRLDSEVKKLDKNVSTLAWLLSSPVRSPLEGLDLKHQITLFRQRLLGMFDIQFVTENSAILDYPEVSHEHLVNRAIARRKPFDQKGSGYRDALIWETILERVAPATDQVLLITNDQDFSDKDGNLHPDLIRDLEDREIANDKVVLIRSIKDLVDERIRPHRKKLSWENPIQALRDYGYDLEDEVARALQNSYSTYVWSPGALNLDTDLENLFLDNVQGLYRLCVLDVRESNESSLLIKIEARLICDFHVFVDKATWYSQVDNSVLEILDPDWNRHCVLATVTSELDCEFDCTIDISRPKHCKTQILSMNPAPMSEVDSWL